MGDDGSVLANESSVENLLQILLQLLLFLLLGDLGDDFLVLLLVLVLDVDFLLHVSEFFLGLLLPLTSLLLVFEKAVHLLLEQLLLLGHLSLQLDHFFGEVLLQVGNELLLVLHGMVPSRRGVVRHRRVVNLKYVYCASVLRWPGQEGVCGSSIGATHRRRPEEVVRLVNRKGCLHGLGVLLLDLLLLAVADEIAAELSRVSNFVAFSDLDVGFVEFHDLALLLILLSLELGFQFVPLLLDPALFCFLFHLLLLGQLLLPLALLLHLLLEGILQLLLLSLLSNDVPVDVVLV
mmetsp:Transcript_20790/g.32038  ORF Transcript_20790/g.32038 Transcript_20790/m.32038 type:complete len:292 (-) Transcript_20790:1556-2431(-)